MTEESPPELDATFQAALREAIGNLAMPQAEWCEFSKALLSRTSSALRRRWGTDIDQLSIPVRPIAWYSLGHHCDDPAIRPSRTLDYACGAFFLQDAGSMLALAACDADDPPSTNRLVCDLCAAPGGKASALLESIGEGFLLANEPIKSRIAPLAYNLARTGNDRYAISSLDPEQLSSRLAGVFDLVVADVPCSGQALLGRGKQSLAAVSKTQIEHSALRARRILTSAIKLLRPGGQLVLSTCTFAEAENESQVRWLLSCDGVSPLPRDRLSGYVSGPQDCSYRLWPHRHECAGSFAASLQCDAIVEARRERSPRRGKQESLPAELSTWFDAPPDRYLVCGAVLRGWPADAPDWVESIAIAGPEVAYRTGRTWKPSHDAAIRRVGLVRGSQSIEVDPSLARDFLAGQPIPCAASGWCVVRHQGRALGWVKASAGVGKNHLPTAARLAIDPDQ